jgi:hypothetical protein
MIVEGDHNGGKASTMMSQQSIRPNHSAQQSPAKHMTTTAEAFPPNDDGGNPLKVMTTA